MQKRAGRVNIADAASDESLRDEWGQVQACAEPRRVVLEEGSIRE